MSRLNFHHLRYFLEVAREGNLTRAAERLNLSQSALSTQIRQLEARLGHALFDRVGRRLDLTEAGGIALDHADRIFKTGDDLVATLSSGGRSHPPLRLGALSTLSRNFQAGFLQPVLADPDLRLNLVSGSRAALFADLRALGLDAVLSTEPPGPDDRGDLIAHRLDEQPVALIGPPQRLRHDGLAAILSAEPVIVPTESSIRTGFDSLVARLGVRPRIVADVDDMAMVRLLAREGIGLAVAPPVVLQEEIATGVLATAPFALDLVESFYAITAQRSFPHPALARLLPAADGSRGGAERRTNTGDGG